MRTILGVVAFAAAMSFTAVAQAQYLIVGNDEKLIFKDGKPVLSPPGKDTVSIIDIRDGSNPRIVANLPVENSVIGPPTNLAITPDNKLALVASSIDVVKDGDSLKNVPDSKVYVIDLTASPPAVIATVQTGKQPSGLAINRAGNLALGRQPRRQQRQRLVDFREDCLRRRHRRGGARRRSGAAALRSSHYARRQARAGG